jgi:hypothetical protein
MKRKDLIQAMVKFATSTAKGEVSTEVLAGSVRTVATLMYALALPSRCTYTCLWQLLILTTTPRCMA